MNRIKFKENGIIMIKLFDYDNESKVNNMVHKLDLFLIDEKKKKILLVYRLGMCVTWPSFLF